MGVTVAIFGDVLTGKRDLQVVMNDDSGTLLGSHHVHHRVVGQINSGLRTCRRRGEPKCRKNQRHYDA
jgi:hypothetical protein